jgi:hypothetical protein
MRTRGQAFEPDLQIVLAKRSVEARLELLLAGDACRLEAGQRLRRLRLSVRADEPAQHHSDHPSPSASRHPPSLLTA